MEATDHHRSKREATTKRLRELLVALIPHTPTLTVAEQPQVIPVGMVLAVEVAIHTQLQVLVATTREQTMVVPIMPHTKDTLSPVTIKVQGRTTAPPAPISNPKEATQTMAGTRITA